MKFTATVLALAACGASAFSPAATFARGSTSLQMGGVLAPTTGKSALDTAVVDRYAALGFPVDKILAEYVWVDGDGNCRSKTRTLPAAKGKAVGSLPDWNFDGSSTGQAPGDDSEVIIK
jgi:glutamine synthetase